MIKIAGTNQSGKPFNHIDTDHHWQYATDSRGNPDMALIEVMRGDECIFTIKAEIVAAEIDELTLVVSEPD